MQPAQQFPGFDPTRPNEARIIDYLLGGKDNFAADRVAAEQAIDVAPELPMMAREGRRFLDRAVRYLAREAGIRQFIDVGCGLPTQGPVHQIAQAEARESRVVYIDIDPLVVTHARALLEGDEQTVVIQADMRDPSQILDHPSLTRMIDLTAPVAVLLVSVLAVIPEDELAHQIVARFRESVVPGSYLAISHATSDLRPKATARLAGLFQDEQIVTGQRRRDNLRTRAEVEPYFDKLELVEPGIVCVPAWRPHLGRPAVDPNSVWAIGGIGRKP